MLKLEAIKDFSYDREYFHKLSGFIYSLIKKTSYSVLHDKKGYKFFCFSNIFPISLDYKIKKGEEKQFLISSPDKVFIKLLAKELKEKIENNEAIRIGEMEFLIKEIKIFDLKLNKNSTLISATPIVIRIPERNYEKYGIPTKLRKRRYVYWRPSYSFEAFVKQLEENLIKKYNEFKKENLKIERIFEIFKFRKGPIINHVIINGKAQIFVGSLWEFQFSYLSKEQKKILEFAIDAGFGERNSLGFGFMNVVR